jgi:hypothetical protein
VGRGRSTVEERGERLHGWKKNLKFVVEGDGVAVSPVLSLWVGVAARGRRWVGGVGRWRWRQRFGEILGENERGRDIRQISF